METNSQTLADQYNALMRAASTQPGVAAAIDVLNAVQAPIMVAQFAEAATFAFVGTTPAISSNR
ncbi:hypothetical protein ACQUFY_16750 [Robbsia andropogonis]|uniref:hypothetical protein n=1 Tax=Robbsia andropogonis TaxID=28092 RepID=UPI003D1C22EF